MSIRNLLALLAATTFAGCAAQTETTDDGIETADEADLYRICTKIYKPVCGKNGKTYSNSCLAGGASRVAHSGECTACDTTKCTKGTHCELQTVYCIKAPCPPIAQCVADVTDPCATVRCASGTHCVASGKSATCEPDVDACATVRCIAGTHCVASGSTATCEPDVNPCATVRCAAGTQCVASGTTATCEPIAKDYCTTAADCKLVDDYCGGCNCLPLASWASPPSCTSPVSCFVQPCLSKTVACESNHCVVR